MSRIGGRAIVLRPGEGRAIDLGGFQMSVKATKEETDGAFSLLEATEPPDFGPPYTRTTTLLKLSTSSRASTSFLSMVGSSSALRDPSFSSQPACPTVSALDAQPAASSTSTRRLRWWVISTS